MNSIYLRLTIGIVISTISAVSILLLLPHGDWDIIKYVLFSSIFISSSFLLIVYNGISLAESRTRSVTLFGLNIFQLITSIITFELALNNHETLALIIFIASIFFGLSVILFIYDSSRRHFLSQSECSKDKFIHIKWISALEGICNSEKFDSGNALKILNKLKATPTSLYEVPNEINKNITFQLNEVIKARISNLPIENILEMYTILDNLVIERATEISKINLKY